MYIILNARIKYGDQNLKKLKAIYIIIASGRASWGPKGPSSRERALTATRVVSD